MVGKIENFALIAASFLIVLISFYIVFCIYQRMNKEKLSTRLYWITGGAFVLGEGVWSLHYIGMIACDIEFVVHYEMFTVLFSMLIIVGASFLFLLIHSAARGRPLLQAVSGIVLACGIGMMHYVGVLAQCSFGYSQEVILTYPLLFGCSILVVGVAVYLSFRRVQSHKQTTKVVILKALIMASTVTIMHYCGEFQTQDMVYPMDPSLISFDTLFMSISIAIVDAMTFGYSVVILVIDRRLTNSEAQLKQLNHNYSLILNTVAEGIYGVDQRGITIFMNPAASKLTGYPVEEIIGRPVHECIHVTELEYVRTHPNGCPVCLPPHRDQRYVTEDLFRRKDGTLFPVEYCITPMFENGQAVGAVVNFTDISDRKRNDELILTSEKLSVAGQLAAGIAHEIRNPLTAISGFVQLMQKGAQAKREYLDIILSELSRVEVIVSELLMLAKPQIHQFSKKDLGKLLQSVISLLETQAIMNDIQLHFSCDPAPLPIYCDEGQMKQVFINLIKNAIEAMAHGGEITVQVMRADHEVVIHITDTGCGMPDGVLSRIGQPFYTTKEQGTGLGLMISNRILTHHKGYMEVTSQVNVGTQFVIRLPLLEQQFISSSDEENFLEKTAL